MDWDGQNGFIILTVYHQTGYNSILKENAIPK